MPRLTFEPAPAPHDEAVAAAAGVPKTTWIRQAIEMALAVQAEDDQPISRAEVPSARAERT